MTSSRCLFLVGRSRRRTSPVTMESKGGRSSVQTATHGGSSCYCMRKSAKKQGRIQAPRLGTTQQWAENGLVSSVLAGRIGVAGAPNSTLMGTALKKDRVRQDVSGLRVARGLWEAA